MSDHVECAKAFAEIEAENVQLRAEVERAVTGWKHEKEQMLLQKDDLHLRLCHLLDAIAQDARSTGPFKITLSKNMEKCFDAGLDTVQKYTPPMSD